MIINIGTTGKLQVWPYAANIMRVRYAPDGIFREKTLNTFVKAGLKADFDDYGVTVDDGIFTLTTSRLRIVVGTTDGRVTFYNLDGEIIVSEEGRTFSNVDVEGESAGDRSVGDGSACDGSAGDGSVGAESVGDGSVGDGKPWYRVGQSFKSDPKESLYGFGNINGVMGIKGETIAVRQGNVEKRSPMFVSNMGYGILFDITSNGELTWTNDNGTYTYTGFAADSMDYYFLYGPDADTVISGYRTMTGKAAMLPKNAFGYTQSRNRYTSQQEVLEIARQFRERRIPLDTIVIDWHWWHDDTSDGLGMFNNILQWRVPEWPDPAGMLDMLHDRHVSASISVWSIFGIHPDSQTFQYIEANKPDFLIRKPSGFMHGYTYDASSLANRAFYWNMVNENVFAKGMDSLWIDANEPEDSGWVTGNEQVEFGHTLPIAAIYSLLTNRCVYEGQRMSSESIPIAMSANQGVYEKQRTIEGTTKRVNTLSRNAVAGTQRYGMQSWSGDIASTWPSLRQEVSGVVNFSATGMPFFSTDTGGYLPLDTTVPSNKELFLRWIQFSTFCSIMRTHGESPRPGTRREPWELGDGYEGYVVDYINLRERLIPYIYSLVGQVYHDDYTMVRPMAFDFREDYAAAHLKDQYMFGPAMLVAPVTTEGARKRDVYLPWGRWTDFWTGLATFSTGQVITADAPLGQIPIFVRAGSIIPMGPYQQYATERSDPVEIRVYVGTDGSFTLYEDEGDNYNYERGECSRITFEWSDKDGTLAVGKREGSFEGMLQRRTFDIVLVEEGYGYGMEMSREYKVSVDYDGGEQVFLIKHDD